MSWFHNHTWELIRETYAEPCRGIEVESCPSEVLLKLANGSTTFIFQCSGCKKIRVEETLGKVK